MKIYLSKSNLCDPGLYIQLKAAIKELDHELYEWENKLSTPKGNDFVIALPPNENSLKNGIVNVGKGLWSEVNKAMSHDIPCYLILSLKKEISVKQVISTERKNNQTDWTKNYGSFYVENYNSKDDVGFPDVVLSIVNHLTIDEKSKNETSNQIPGDTGSNIPGYLAMINKRKKYNL